MFKITKKNFKIVLYIQSILLTLGTLSYIWMFIISIKCEYPKMTKKETGDQIFKIVMNLVMFLFCMIPSIFLPILFNSNDFSDIEINTNDKEK